MSSKKKLSASCLYIITDLKKKDSSIFHKTEQALRGGADILQLRSKTLMDKEFLAIGKRLKAIVKKYKKLFIVNDRPHIAKLLKADGLHLGQDDLSLKNARRIVGDKMILGKSTHSLAQALAAEKEGAHYIGVGPIFTTPTKPSYNAVGLKLVRRVSRKIKIPFVAIGGIDVENVVSVIKAGAKTVAVVRAVFETSDPYQSSRRLRKVVLKQIRHQSESI